MLRVALALAVLVGVSWSTPKHPINKPNGNQQKSEYRKGDTVTVGISAFPIDTDEAAAKKKERAEESDFKTSTTHLTIGIVFFTFCLVGVTWFLACYTKQLVNVTRTLATVAGGQWTAMVTAETRATTADIFNKASRQQELRAYIHVDSEFKGDITELNDLVSDERNRGYVATYTEGPEIGQNFPIYPGRSTYPNPPKTFEYSIIIRNEGKTPAHKVIINPEALIIKPRPSINDSDPLKWVNAKFYDAAGYPHFPNNSMGPNSKIDLIIKFENAISEEDIERLRDGNHAIYIFGTIIYNDAFYDDNKTFRKTRFCYSHSIVKGGKIFGKDLEAYYEYNDAT